MVIPFSGGLVVRDNGRNYTKNLDPGHRVYGERLVPIGEYEFREWSPYRSKLSAYISTGGNVFPFKKDSCILYLGAASGTTASHISDLVPDGKVYCVEFSPRTFRDLVMVCERRKNMIPILGDATAPDSYSFAVDDVDIVYQDVAQKRQAEILMRNMNEFSAACGMVSIKARSEDVAADPFKIFDNAKKELISNGMTVTDMRTLEPYEKDHTMIAVSR